MGGQVFENAQSRGNALAPDLRFDKGTQFIHRIEAIATDRHFRFDRLIRIHEIAHTAR